MNIKIGDMFDTLVDKRLFQEFVFNYTGNIVYCTIASPDRFNELQTHLLRLQKAKAVDRIVVICNNLGKTKRWKERDLLKLQKIGAETYQREWNGSFPDARNAYLQKCQHGDWVICSDTDEHFSDNFIYNLRQILSDLNKRKKFYARINAHDIIYSYNHKPGVDPEPIPTVSDHMKLLIFKRIPSQYYRGIGTIKTVHETLMPPPDQNYLIDLPKIFYYTHTKTEPEIWARALRNVYLSGGGNNSGQHNKSWIPLLKICRELDINTYFELDEYLKKGNIHKSLKDWIINNRQRGMNYEDEMVDIFKYYFYYLHPEEKPSDIDVIEELAKGGLAELMNFVGNSYMTVFGRHASDDERFHYANLIINNKIKREQFIDILKDLEKKPKPTSQQSKPKKEENKNTDMDMIEELPLVNLPLKVDIQLSENIIDQILRHSRFYNEHIRYLTEIGKRWMIQAAINYKIETQGRGDDKQDLSSYKHYIDNIKKIIPPREFPKILDIGAGAGDETKALLDAGYDVIGLTLGIDNIRSAKERYNIKLLEEDMHCLQFPKDYFDAIILIHTYEHSYSSMMLLGELYHVLRDLGRIYVAVPDPEAEESKTIWHVNLRLDWQIIQEFAYYGFRLVSNLNNEDKRDKYTFVFEKLPPGDPEFKNYNYLQYIINLRNLLS